MNFDDVRKLIDGDRHEELAAALRDVDPLRRKELAGELKTYERQERPDWGTFGRRTAFAVAGACLLPNASTLAPWLVRNELRRDAPDSAGVVLEALRHRDVPWLPDLGARLAARMPMRDVREDLFRLVVELCGDTPPDTDGFLRHLAIRGPAHFRPGYEVLVPRMLEVVGVGGWLRNEAWPPFLLTKAGRDVLLDGCLSRLQQGGAPGEVMGFLALHEVLHPTVDEVAAHAKDYVAILPDSRSPVATLAQEQLKGLGESLDFALLCDASRWVFGRTDKKLVRTQLTWLGTRAKERPDEVLLVVAELFAHESADLRGRAVSLVHKHIGEVTDATRREITALAEQLPADLAARLGATTAEAEPVAELAPFVPEAMPEPIASPDELCREILPMFAHTSEHFDPVVVERVLEALVRFAWQDRDALRTALRPLFAKHEWLERFDRERSPTPRGEFCQVLVAAVTPPRRAGLVHRFKERRAQFAEPMLSNPTALLTGRLFEITTGLSRSPRPALVSTPTSTSGLLDPDVLAARLARADAEGWLPWPDDLWQALRRLPRGARITVAPEGKASRLPHEWAGHRDPEVVVVERSYTPRVYYASQRVVTEHRLLATVTPGLPDPQRHWHGYQSWGHMIECWSAALPAQRETVAAHLVPHLAHRTVSKGDDGPLLPALARADGPIGAGTWLALAYGLGAELPVGRAYAVDALLVLASRDQLDGTALGDTVGQLLQRGELVPGRVVPALRDASRSGAARQLWDLLAAALPRAWGHNRVADLLELAVEVAELVRPGGEVDGLAAVAARKGSSRTVTEAKRLVAALNGC